MFKAYPCSPPFVTCLKARVYTGQEIESDLWDIHWYITGTCCITCIDLVSVQLRLCLLAVTRSHCLTCKMMLKISQIRKRKGTRLYPRISDLFMLIFCFCLDRPFEATVKKQYADYEIIMAAVVAVLIILILSCILYLW